MSGEQLEEAGLERLDAAVFEQRRLSHMLRRRGAEIESLRGDRERLVERERKALKREEELRGVVDALKERAESIGAERDQLAAQLKQAEYEARRSERRLAKASEDAVKTLEQAREESAEALKGARYETRRAERRAAETAKDAAEARGQAERREAKTAKAAAVAGERAVRAERRLEEMRQQLSTLTSNRDRLASELKQKGYEARRAERRMAKAERDAAEARGRDRLQLEALRAELRAGLSSRDEALKREQGLLVERDAIREERDAFREERDAFREERDATLAERDEALAAAGASGEIEAIALELGRAQRDVELYVGLEKEREVLLADSERALASVAEHLRRVRASRSWRWGHSLAQFVRALTFRRRSKRSALDAALDRLGADRAGATPG